MVTNELISYIKGELQKGLSTEQIRAALLTAGWQEQDIQDAFNQIANPTTPQPPVSPIVPEQIISYSANNSESTQETTSENFYPTIHIDRIQDPGRFFSIPIIGGFIKLILLIPVFIELGILYMINWIFQVINALIVLFSGNYWNFAYRYNAGLMRLSLKLNFYLFGLTNKYPGFNFEINDIYAVDIPYPEHPNRLFAVPLIGILIRSVLMIPFIIYQVFISQAAAIGAFIFSWPLVLFKKQYPESTFELVRDQTRLALSYTMYLTGLSDKYPSFKISMNHKKMKMLLIGISLIYILFSFGSSIYKSVTGINAIKNIKHVDTENINSQQLSQLVNFEVLLPSVLPAGYSYTGYTILPAIFSNPSSYKTNASQKSVVILAKEKVSGNQITITETGIPENITFQEKFVYAKYLSKETSINHNKAYLYNLPSSDQKTQDKRLIWSDNARTIEVLFVPATILTDEEAINFAESFYK